SASTQRSDAGARRHSGHRPRGKLLALCRRWLAQAAQRPDAQWLRPGAVRWPLRAARRRHLWPLDAADPAAGARQGRSVRRQPQFPAAGRASLELLNSIHRLSSPSQRPIRAYRLSPMLRTVLIAGFAVLALAACAKRTKPPGGEGICWHIAPQANGTMKYNKLKADVPALDTSAAQP